MTDRLRTMLARLADAQEQHRREFPVSSATTLLVAGIAIVLCQLEERIEKLEAGARTRGFDGRFGGCIGEVIDRMLALIPAEEAELRSRLVRVKDDAAFTAPEAMGAAWAKGAVALEERFGEDGPPEGWPQTIVRIWIGAE